MRTKMSARNFVSVIFLLIAQTQLKNATGCEDGWIQYHSKCYYFSKVKSTYLVAADFCHLLGGKLAEPTTIEENNFLEQQRVKYASDPDKYWYFIGGTDMFVENEWVYLSTRQPIPNHILNWYPGQPNSGDAENCLVVGNKNLMHDYPCDSTGHFACEKSSTGLEVGNVLG